MNRDKQIDTPTNTPTENRYTNCIDEMATKMLIEVNRAGNEISFKNLATVLYNAGYRKSTDLAREIFEEIEDVLNNIGYFDEIDFKALKKKYTEGEG